MVFGPKVPQYSTVGWIYHFVVCRCDPHHAEWQTGICFHNAVVDTDSGSVYPCHIRVLRRCCGALAGHGGVVVARRMGSVCAGVCECKVWLDQVRDRTPHFHRLFMHLMSHAPHLISVILLGQGTCTRKYSTHCVERIEWLNEWSSCMLW
jgi:hypothetical protein